MNRRQRRAVKKQTRRKEYYTPEEVAAMNLPWMPATPEECEMVMIRNCLDHPALGAKEEAELRERLQELENVTRRH